MIKRVYGYKMFDCTLDDWNKYVFNCWDKKVSPNPTTIFPYMKFNSIDEGIDMIGNYFIPAEHEKLATIDWEIKEDQTLLIKNVTFSNQSDSELYQTAVERAWALGGHLDLRVKQIYYD